MNIYGLAFSAYRAFGRDAAKRLLTPPRSLVEGVCARTGADVETALRERDEAAEAVLEFLESMLDSDQAEAASLHQA